MTIALGRRMVGASRPDARLAGRRPRGVGLGARAWLVAALLALVSAVVGQSAVASIDGSLTRLGGKAGCLSLAVGQGCAQARGLDGPNSVAVSPGGGSVYVASVDSDAVAVFRRAGRTGALRQLRGRAGCLSLAGRHGCGGARALRDPFAIVASPDGRNVYVASAPGHAIVVFGRDRRTGALRQLRGSAGCVSDRPGVGCRAGRALAGVSSLALGPGGRFLYAGTGTGLAVFRRDTRTGRLVQLRGAGGCVTGEALRGCARARALAGVSDVALDRGGDNLYAASAAVAVFDLVAGVPRQLRGAAGCISHLGEAGCTAARALLGPYALAASPNGAQLYATAGGSGTVAGLARDRATGALSQPAGPLGCIRDGGGLDCAFARYLNDPSEIAFSPDGRNAYVTAVGNLVVLRRNRATGRLSQLPGKAGCIAEIPPYADCTDSRGLNAIAIALSPDGRNAYITSDTDAIAVYRRAR